MGHALAAYYMACKFVNERPPGRRFVSFEGTPYCTREAFGDHLVYLFEKRVKGSGYELGVNDAWKDELKWLLRARLPQSAFGWFPDELIEPTPDHVPAKGGGTTPK
ncbi:hypothetical protein B0E41_09010 [Hydrogenophaga sp. A37]|nr:hypothetical protein B0E41_09010 [Hydrogenophaga sp. A37]